MKLSSWGRFPIVESRVLEFGNSIQLARVVNQEHDLIAFGNGRSYGDSALSEQIIKVKPHNKFLRFNQDTGELKVEAGVLLSEILEALVPRGWFLKVTPGTKLITIGGAIASDVHGKNHHIEGCFSESVKELKLMLPGGETVNCSLDENVELFKATCGGMGLTGIILTANIYLKRIHSTLINQKIIKTKNIEETFEAFENHKDFQYSVAWIDCMATGKDLGKSLLMLGEFSKEGKLRYKPGSKLNIPFDFPSFALNSSTVSIFNWLYYRKVRKNITESQVDIDSFFYPLDSINNWNRIYGKNGFTQYQFILPKEKSLEGLREILKTISASGKGSFLAVLKLYGKVNENYLSFPMEGYSLALDFKIEKGLFPLLDQLDKIVVNNHGRIYLSKDVRVSKEVFEKGYPKIDLFRSLRTKFNMDKKFNSLQSKRVGI